MENSIKKNLTLLQANLGRGVKISAELMVAASEMKANILIFTKTPTAAGVPQEAVPVL